MLRLRAMLLLTALPMLASAYDSGQHQALTFLAAKHFNRCVIGTEVPMLTPLEVRYMVRSNVALSDANFFLRLFRWNYYEPEQQSEKSLLWIFETRFHKYFNELVSKLERADDPNQAFRDLGRVVGFVQLVTSPAHAVPVFTARFWRFSFSDRFDAYPVDTQALEARIGAECEFLDDGIEGYAEVLERAADSTLAALGERIPGMPVTWEAFWTPSRKPGDFGDYGRAGNNFGRRAEFRCSGQRCVLVNDDPLYEEFALDRHADAVRATQRVMLLMQTRTRETLARAE